MPLKAVIEKLEDVPESDRRLYTERDGKYWVDIEAVGGVALEDIDGLKTSLSKEREGRRAAEKAAEGFGDLKPDSVRAALAELEELKAAGVSGKLEDQIQAVKAQLEERHKAALAERDTAISELTGQLEDEIVTSTGTAAIAELKGSVDLLLPIYKRHVKMRNEDGRQVARVFDENGNVRLTGESGKDHPMTPQEYVTSLSKDSRYAAAFPGSGATGGGTDPTGQGSRAGGSVDSSLSPTERLKAARRNTARA